MWRLDFRVPLFLPLSLPGVLGFDGVEKSRCGSAIEEIYPVRQSFTVDIERHRKLEFRAGVLQHSGIILDQHIL